MEGRDSAASLPTRHQEFLDEALSQLRRDPRLVGVAIGGSVVTRSTDAFSDLDLVIAVEPSEYEAVLRDMPFIAGRLGPLLASFVGDHVGEPRLLICLYGPPLLHVDLKFVNLTDLGHRVEDPEILWERAGRFTEALKHGEAHYPQPDLQWIEDRFWVWVHYAASKIERGELFEAIGFLSFLRAEVLGPLTLASRSARPSGVRKLEMHVPEMVAPLKETVPTYNSESCTKALASSIKLYRELRDILDDGSLTRNGLAENAVLEYVREMGGSSK